MHTWHGLWWRCQALSIILSFELLVTSLCSCILCFGRFSSRARRTFTKRHSRVLRSTTEKYLGMVTILMYLISSRRVAWRKRDRAIAPLGSACYSIPQGKVYWLLDWAMPSTMEYVFRWSLITWSLSTTVTPYHNSQVSLVWFNIRICKPRSPERRPSGPKCFSAAAWRTLSKGQTRAGHYWTALLPLTLACQVHRRRTAESIPHSVLPGL